MGSPLDRVDRVGEGEHVLDERVVVLKGDLHLRALDLAVDVEGNVVDHLLVAVEGADEGDDSAFEVEGVGEAELLIRERDLEALVEVCHLAQTALDDLAVECGVGEDLRVRPEPDDRAGVVRLAHDLDRALRHAGLELHVMDLAAPVDPHLELLAEEVHRRDAHSVQAGRHLVSTATELSAGVEARQDQLQGRHPFFLVDVDRDAAAVVLDLDAAVGVEIDGDLGRIACQGLVDCVVHDLVDQVVEARGGG